MDNPLRISLLGFCLFFFVACNQSTSAPETTVTDEDMRLARQAMRLSDISLMLRNGFSQQSIIHEVIRRRVSTKLDAGTEGDLVRSGAKPALILALKTEANVLTENQRKAYDQLASERQLRAAKENAVLEKDAEKISKDRLARQTVMNVPRKSSEEAYWEAQAAYESKKKSLEAKISAQQAWINRLRTWGYTQAELAQAQDRLEGYKEELKNLSEPIR